VSLATDPSDVHADLEGGDERFIVLDARTPEAYARGHVPPCPAGRRRLA
jgi:rhodanese-related sulfurtransferase